MERHTSLDEEPIVNHEATSRLIFIQLIAPMPHCPERRPLWLKGWLIITSSKTQEFCLKEERLPDSPKIE